MHLYHHRRTTLLLRTSTQRFSTGAQQPPKKPKGPSPSASVKKKPVMLMSEYGELLNIKSMVKAKPEVQYKEVQMIGDNSDAKTIMKKMNTSPNTFFLFDPKAHFTNA